MFIPTSAILADGAPVMIELVAGRELSLQERGAVVKVF